MKVFSGRSNPDLAKKIARDLGSELGGMEISHFANGEARILVTEKKVDKTVVVVQSLSAPTNDHLIEFCLICDALRRVGAEEIIAVIPWMGYSKQDKVFRSGESLSAKVVAQIIQVARPSRIITVDLHNRATLGFFDSVVTEISARPLFLEYFQGKTTENTLVAAPDEGAVKASTQFARELGLPVVYMDKKRDLESGKVEIVGMSRQVRDAQIIMIDDNVFTGSTLLAAAKELKMAGAHTIRVCLTHHLYVPGVQEKLEKSGIDEIIATDTIAGPKSSKLKILSVSKLIAESML